MSSGAEIYLWGSKIGLNMDLSERKVKKVLQEVIATVRAWERYAEYVGLSERSSADMYRFLLTK